MPEFKIFYGRLFPEADALPHQFANEKAQLLPDFFNR